MASAKMSPAPETLPAKDLIGEPGTKDAWAKIERDVILNAIRQSTCLSEQVFWFLILTSRCGPTVREGCFLRDRRGYTIRDKAGQEIPVRQRDVGEALEIENRSLVHKAIRKLVSQKKLTIGDDGIWYPVMDPARLNELLSSNVSDSGQKRNTLGKTHYIGIRIPAELYEGSQESVSETIAVFESIQQEFDSEHTRIQKQYRDRLKQAISERRIIIDEEIEEIREEIHGGGGSEEYVHPEEPPPPDSEYLPLPPETDAPEVILTPEEQISQCLTHYFTRMHPGTDQPYPDAPILRDILRVMRKAHKTVADLWALFEGIFRRGGTMARGYAWFRRIVEDEWGDAGPAAAH